MSSDVVELLKLARNGDEDARGAVLETYRSYLEMLAQLEIGHRLRMKVDAGDLVQETFLEAHRNFGLFRGVVEAEFNAWLRSILAARIANVVRHFVGTQGRDIRRETDLGANLDHSSCAFDRGLAVLQSTPSQQLIRQEQRLKVANTLARLPKEYREVIMLRHFEDLSISEIASRMNRTIDSVQKLWVRGLAQLREFVQEAP